MVVIKIIKITGEQGQLSDWSTRVLIKRVWVQVLAGEVGEFSCPTFCAFGIHFTPVLLQ